jgi:hypothetical protein
MGLPFPVYTPAELNALDAQQRAALKAQILATVQNDPEIQGLLQPCLDQVRPLLRAATGELMARFRRRAG